MTQPIAPPSESGWYVVEDAEGEIMIGLLEVNDELTGADFYFADIPAYWRFEDNKLSVRGLVVSTVARYRPIDPAAYLKGEE